MWMEPDALIFMISVPDGESSFQYRDIGLAKKFVWVFLQCLMEKNRTNFWANTISTSWPSGSGLWGKKLEDRSGNKKMAKHEDWTSIAGMEKEGYS